MRRPRPLGSTSLLLHDLFIFAALTGFLWLTSSPQTPRSAKAKLQRIANEQRQLGPGGNAETPAKIPAKGWLDIARRVIESFQNDRVLLIAAGVTFYALLALFPTVAAIVSIYGLLADPTSISDQLQSAAGILPEGAVQVVGEQAKRVASQGHGALGLAFIGSLAVSLWGANAGTKAIFDALNVIYKQEEKRGFIVLNLRSLAFTLGAIAVVILAVAGIVVVPVALKLLGIPDGSAASLLTLLRWPVLYAVILFALACLYRYGPSRTPPRWRWVTWGSAMAGAAWVLGSLLLSWYVANFGTYNATYGSLGAVIGFMIWMWLSTIVILAGAEINAEIENQANHNHSPRSADKELALVFPDQRQ